jgi:ribosome maturation factor RimP
MPSFAEKLNSRQHLAQLRQVIEPVCAAHGVALVDARFTQEHGFCLRVLIEHPQATAKSGAGVSLEHCQGVSRDLSTALDISDGVAPDAAYRLEVGSPGLDRPLFSLSDFARFAGEPVKVQTHGAVMVGSASANPVGRRRFSGTLLGVDGNNVKLNVDGEDIAIDHNEIAKANLVFRF